MSIKEKLFQGRFGEILRFAVTGGLSFLVDFGIMTALTELLHMDPVLSGGISFVISVVVNYLLCVLWVFDGVDRKSKTNMAIFLLTSVIGLGLNEFFMWLFVHILGIHYMLSKIVTTLIVMVWNYITKRAALMRQSKKTQD